ncbi:hypothetical protein RDWZM_005341 [Blomia tropicalis]|uniref:furin n=1 Tax=Blomia tropicalis TaxID=40697 RepID=A0A9Q0M5Q5_BLOTA|nr:hypothetical protein RDWZM_005341 [Blomia tropicalis]
MSSGPTLSRQTVPRKDVASMLSPNENKIVTNRKELILENENENKNVHNEILGIDDGQWKKLNQNAHVFTNQFVIESKYDPDHIKILAQQHGFDYLGHIFGNFHHLKHRKIAKRSVEGADERHHGPLNLHPSVISLKQQTLKRRTKRDFLETPTKRRNHVRKEVLPFYSSSHQRHFQQAHPPLLPFSREYLISAHDYDNQVKFDDPQWPRMWYLNRGNGLDMNVEGAWMKNITGRNVVVTILDDGLEKDHPDLMINYDPKASTDVNGLDDDPMPRYDIIDSNRHGTRCAGEVAANANNSVCAVGVAFNAKVGGIRMLDGDVTDAVEARSLSHNQNHIDIYSASWGPDDDGRTVDGPGDLAAKAFENGIINGRRGKGSIFVWASGNGGREKDNCNCDGYTNSIWTLSISSATEKGAVPWYSEACSSTLATTYSSGSFGERQIVTTDLHHGCTASHTGTSASAPLAAGICALALEANSNLTWRDMQHIVVLTAKRKNLNDKDWITNGVGRNVSHWFGYGLLDASAMVDFARNWTKVPDQSKCEVRFYVNIPNGTIRPGTFEKFKGHKVNCTEVGYLEHVQVKVNLTAQKRGDIEIKITSPAGTTSTLLAVRPMDNSRSGFANWPFMTVHDWGEQPNGYWELTVINHGRNSLATLNEWSLVMHGTKNNPYKEDLIRKFKIHQTHPNKSDEFTKDPSSYQILLDSDNRIDGPSSSPSAKNQTKDIMVESSNIRNMSSSTFVTKQRPLPKVFDAVQLPPIPHNPLDDRDEMEHEKDVDWRPNPTNRHQTHYMASINRQTDQHQQQHKYYQSKSNQANHIVGLVVITIIILAIIIIVAIISTCYLYKSKRKDKRKSGGFIEIKSDTMPSSDVDEYVQPEYKFFSV